MEIKPFKKEDAIGWDKFSLESDDAWFWHTINYMNFALWYKPSTNPVNKSFLIRNGKEILAIFPLIIQTIDENKVFRYGYQYTPQPCFRNQDSPDFKRKLLIMGMKEIDQIARKENCKECYMEITPLAKNSFFKLRYNYLMDFDFLITDTVTQIVKVDPNIEKVKQGIRKTYKQIFRYHAPEVKYNIYDRNNITLEIFLKYKELHHKDAGRKTRPDETFRLMFDAIVEGNAFLSEVTSAENKPLGYGLFYLYKNCALYGSAATEPTIKLPIGHLVQWNALQYLSKIGVELYDTSNQFPSFQLLQDFDPKKKQISFFKRGFGGELHQVFRGRKFFDQEYLKKEVLKQPR